MIADKEKIVLWFSSKRFLRLSAFICVNLWLILLTSCATKPSEMRSLVPAESLVYLEMNDLAAAIQPIVDSKPFTEAAKKKPDLSVLKGVQMAVAVLGFEATEEKLTDEQSVGSVKPRFVAVVDTHAWNYQANAFAEQKIGAFVTDIYGGEPKLEKSDKGGGKYYAWSAEDGKKAFALVIDSIIYFANDETAIDKCLAVRRGESDSIIKNDKIKPIEPGTLARGYITNDGVNQIAALVGMKLASEASDESEIQTAIAGILPQLIRGTVTDVTWTMTKGDQGIEDKYQVGMPQDVANVFSETMAPIGENFVAKDFVGIPSDVTSATVYNLKDPSLALQSIVQVSTKQADAITKKIAEEIFNSLFEPYGIRSTQAFFANVKGRILSAKYDDSGEHALLIFDQLSSSGLKPMEPRGSSLTSASSNVIPFLSAPDESGFKVLVSEDNEVKAGFSQTQAIFGESASVSRFVQSSNSSNGLSVTAEYFSKSFVGSRSPVLTLGRDRDTIHAIVSALDSDSEANERSKSMFATETRFTKSGMERRTVSDFGLIGQIIAQLADN
ncbi:MAG: hypothetical protein JNL64_02785 [Blastocatellia bacterium]|nr:hypothetical protein [Blastocatellia bacterium]